MAAQALGRDRPDEVQFVGQFQPNPLLDVQVGDDHLLPRALERPLAVVLERDRHRLGPAFAARERDRDRQQRGGVATAGEADHARRPRERRADQRFEGRARTTARGHDRRLSDSTRRAARWPARTASALRQTPTARGPLMHPQEPAPSRLSVWGPSPDSVSSERVP